jgi:MFS family permease
VLRHDAVEQQHERWAHLHVNWTAVWLGALAAFSAVLVFGLIGTAVGAYLVGPENRVVDLHKMGIATLIFSVCGAFFAFAIGGWIAGKVAGILHSEPGMLHGGIVWLVAVPLLLAAAALGASKSYGDWCGGLGSPANAPFVRPDPLAPTRLPRKSRSTGRSRRSMWSMSGSGMKTLPE